MDIFQVYNRQQNTWVDENIELMPSWSESWVLDKTTDSASVKLKYKSLIAPNWVKGDWCRILHLEGEDTGATYEKRVLTAKYNQPALIQWENVQVTNGYKVRFFTDSEIPLSFKFYISGYLGGNVVVSSEATIWSNHDYTNSDTFTSVSGVVVEGAKEFIYVPKNHEQYIIKDISKIYDKINNEIDIQITLQEPIEMASGINCETMSFTNQISKVVDGITYEHEALNHLSVLEKILKVTPANNDDYVNQTRQQRKSWFNRIKIADGILLMNLPFNDETINESTIYEILLNKYDSSVGRTPVIYFDINPSTDLPNNTNRDEYILCFERQDGFEKEEVELGSLLGNTNQVTENSSGENFVEGLISNYDNLSPNNNIYTPAEVLWLVPEVDTNNRLLDNFTDTKGEWVLKLPHNIKKVNSVVRYLLKIDTYYSGVGSREYISNTSLHEIKNFNEENLIFEEKQYKASQLYYEQPDCVWYSEGENLIHLNEAHYVTTNSEGQLDGANERIWIYQIIYEPLINGRFDLGKDYQMSINQIEAQIDNEKFSKYLKNYINSLNKTDLTIVKTIENFGDVVDIGTRVIGDNKTYIITNVSIQNRGFVYDVVYQLNENHIRKNDNIEAPQEIRRNIEIGIDATKERKSMFCKEFKLSLVNVDNNLTNEEKQNFLSCLFKTYNSGNYPQLAYLKLKSSVPFVSSETTQLELLCEIARFVINDTICFNFRFFDNAEAGKKKILQHKVHTIALSGTLIERSVDFYGMPKEQSPILYTDYFGEFEGFDVKLLNINGLDYITLDEGDNDTERVEYIDNIHKMINSMASFPLASSIDASQIENPVIEVNNINYYKDMLDTFNYTLGYHIESDNNIVVCDNLIKNNVLMTTNKKQLKYIQTRTRNMTEQDYLNERINYATTEITSSTYNNGEFVITFPQKDVAKSVLLLDEDKNVLLIINDFDKTTNNTTFNEIRLYC